MTADDPAFPRPAAIPATGDGAPGAQGTGDEPEGAKAAPDGSRAGRRRGSGPTVADVARAAGVSPMTVSRVINGGGNVREDTRQRVDAAVRALGYVPDPAARSLAGGRTLRVALLYANPSAAYLSEFLVGTLRATSARTLLTLEQHSPGEPPERSLARLADHRIEAVLLPPPLCDDAALVQAAIHAGLAVAQVATGTPHPLATAVVLDDAAAAQAMTSHLIALGHRRIGFITGAADQIASTRRLAGYRTALQQAGITPEPDLVAAGDFTWRGGFAASEQLIARRPSAIFASNDDMAAAAVAAAHRHGLDVPRDLSIVGFDDTTMATTIWPELTTIRQPIAEMAETAMDLLVETTLAGTPPVHLTRAFGLIERASATRYVKRGS